MWPRSQVGDRVYYIDDTDAIVASLVTLAYFLLIPVLLQGLKGFTPGKGIMGVRTVDEQGQVPGIGKALVRSLMWIVDAKPWVIPSSRRSSPSPPRDTAGWATWRPRRS